MTEEDRIVNICAISGHNLAGVYCKQCRPNEPEKWAKLLASPPQGEEKE